MTALSIALRLVRRRLTLVGLLAASLCAPAWAQTGGANRKLARTYKEDRPRDVPIAEQTNARTMLRTGVVTDKDLIDAVYRWRCAQLTWTSKLNETADLRLRLKADLRAAERAAKPDAFDRLTPLVLKSMVAIVNDQEYHPTVRLNAMLLLGDLDARVVSGGAARFVPHPEALPHLLSVAEDSAESVTGAGDAIRCAALHGLLRHGRSAAPDSAERQAISKAAIAMASNATAPEGRNEAVHEWIRRRAVTVLEASVRPGASDLDEQASDLLHVLIANRDEPLKLRLEAAQAFGRTQKEHARDALAATQLAQSLGALTIDLLNSEVVQVGRTGSTVRSAGSRELLTHGLSKISAALRTVEASPVNSKAASAGNGAPNPEDPSAVQYLRSRLITMRKSLGDVQANDAVTARNSTLLANDLNAWLDREAVVQTTPGIPDAVDEEPK
ncbi:MAG: hypothetical protein HY000_06915 [Planctomycetes bacterium]|nr:hypothetical protein [Planctomycetota bacterium]